jgi:hypothetical protein
VWTDRNSNVKMWCFCPLTPVNWEKEGITHCEEVAPLSSTSRSVLSILCHATCYLLGEDRGPGMLLCPSQARFWSHLVSSSQEQRFPAWPHRKQLGI